VTTIAPDPIRGDAAPGPPNGSPAPEVGEASRRSGTILDELLPVMRSIVEWHVRGTRYGVGVDPADGLLRAGEPGVQLTWMDAKIGDFVVTPRIGKPVEIQALWYNALRSLAALLAARCDATAEEYTAMADRLGASCGYHQGPVRSWLLGAYAEAQYRVHGDRRAALALLRPIEHHLRDACLGSVSEILEGDPPHHPVGCVAQAWGVAEILRVWRALSGTGSPLS
jgi:glycogen debranching enzyme